MLAFVLFAALVTITPGLDTMLVIRTAAISGRRAAMAAALGIGLGCLCWAAASALGITALLTASEWGYQVLRIAGAGYLFFLGVRALVRARRPRPGTGPAPSIDATWVTTSSVNEALARQPAARGVAGAFRVGLTTNLLNPKIGVFYLSVLPQFLPKGAAPLTYSLMLALIHDLEGLLWFALLVFVVGRAAGWLARPGVQRRLEQVTGVVFIGFGLRLALEKAPT